VTTANEGKKEPTIEEIRRFSNGCMVYFFLPVLLVGLGIIGWGYYETSLGGYGYEYYFWGFVAAAIGGIPIGAYIVNRESFLVGIQLRKAHPKQPWMWREDWRTGVIRDRSRHALVAAWARALAVTAILFAIVGNAWDLVLELLETYPWQTQLGLAAAGLIPLAFLGGAMYVTLRQQRFGGATLHVKKTPVEPGQRFAGRLETTLADIPQEGMSFRLSCIGFIRRGKSSTQETIWSGSAVTDSMRIIPGPYGVTIPVEIAIPPDAKTSANGGPGANYQWRLSATASVPGVDFAAEFDVPVFRVGSNGRAIDSDVG
jgi:hypothetical protein